MIPEIWKEDKYPPPTFKGGGVYLWFEEKSIKTCPVYLKPALEIIPDGKG